MVGKCLAQRRADHALGFAIGLGDGRSVALGLDRDAAEARHHLAARAVGGRLCGAQRVFERQRHARKVSRRPGACCASAAARARAGARTDRSRSRGRRSTRSGSHSARPSGSAAGARRPAPTPDRGGPRRSTRRRTARSRTRGAARARRARSRLRRTSGSRARACLVARSRSACTLRPSPPSAQGRRESARSTAWATDRLRFSAERAIRVSGSRCASARPGAPW